MFLTCVPEKTWHEAADLIPVSHIVWGLILHEGFEKRSPITSKFVHKASHNAWDESCSKVHQLSKLVASEDRTMWIRSRSGKTCRSTLHGVFTDCRVRLKPEQTLRHCTMQNVQVCRIYMYNICTCMCRPAICSILPLNLCVQHLDNVWTFLANTVGWTLLLVLVLFWPFQLLQDFVESNRKVCC